MLATAMASQPQHITEHVRTLQTSAFAIDLPDNSVDSIFCMRLLHHIQQPEHRLALLKEFHRTTRDSVIISLWVDGNYKAWRRKELEKNARKEAKFKKNSNRFVIRQKKRLKKSSLKLDLAFNPILIFYQLLHVACLCVT